MKKIALNIKTFFLCVSMLQFSEVVAQTFDQEAFCTGINTIFRAMTQDPDEMKGRYIGVNSKNIQQWEVKHMMPLAVSGVYEFETAALQDFHRAGFIMSPHLPAYQAEALYMTLVEAVAECFGTQYVFQENVTIEIDSRGNEYRVFDGNFRYNGNESGFSSTPPDILVRSYAFGRDAFIVTIDMLSKYLENKR